MEQKTINVYEFKELNDSVREKVLDRFRETALDYGWWDWLVEDFLNSVKEELDLDFNEKDLSFSFDRDYHISLNDSVVQSELCSKFWSKGLVNVDLPNRFGFYSNHLGGGIMSSLNESEVNDNICEVEYEGDENDLKDIVKQKLHEKKVKELNDSVREILEKLHEKMYILLKSLRDEYEYRLSDENIKELIEINEYKFRENGDLE